MRLVIARYRLNLASLTASMAEDMTLLTALIEPSGHRLLTERRRMAHTNRVVRSINLSGETNCVDIFVRPDGTFGFDEYRRDPDDGRGWFSVGHYDTEKFATVEAVVDRAKRLIPWLEAAMHSLQTEQTNVASMVVEARRDTTLAAMAMTLISISVSSRSLRPNPFSVPI